MIKYKTYLSAIKYREIKINALRKTLQKNLHKNEDKSK